MKRILPLIVSTLLAAIMILSTVVIAFAGSKPQFNGDAATNESTYENIDINKISNFGGNPDEISGSMSASGEEKPWYEYITYSPTPVASYRIDNDQRLLFYDPYEYSGSMIMSIENLETSWGSYSSLSKTVSQSRTLSSSDTESLTLSSAVQHQNGVDQTLNNNVSLGNTSGLSQSIGSSVTSSWNASVSNTTTAGVKSSIDSETIVSAGSSQKISASETIGKDIVGLGSVKLEASEELSINESVSERLSVGAEVSASDSISIAASESGSTNAQINNAISQNVTSSESKTSGWSVVADRITSSTGSSYATSTSWSNSESVSFTVNYAATHFNDDGVPYQWNIAHYVVKMPMYCEKQYKVGGEWITTSSSYTVLTTIEGTCRTWIQNNKVYYEYWGTGEPVTWEDFFSTKYFTEASLVAAYKNKLLPDAN